LFKVFVLKKIYQSFPSFGLILCGKKSYCGLVQKKQGEENAISLVEKTNKNSKKGFKKKDGTDTGKKDSSNVIDVLSMSQDGTLCKLVSTEE